MVDANLFGLPMSNGKKSFRICQCATHRAMAFIAAKRFNASHTDTFPLTDLPSAPYYAYARNRIDYGIKVVVKARSIESMLRPEVRNGAG